MSRSRNIKPGLFRNEVLGQADPLLTILFQSLWCIADRDGILEDRPLRIKADTFPYREIRDMDGMLQWLHDQGFVVRYMVGDKRLIQIVEFAKHQNPHKNEKPSEYQPYTGESVNIGTKPEKIGTTRADSFNLIPDSLIPDSKEEACASSSDEAPKRNDPIPYQAIADAFNANLEKLPKVRSLTAKRRTLIRTAWQANEEHRTKEFWSAYFEECATDPFLSGVGPYKNGHENWLPSFDYLLRADVVTRVYEKAMDRMERGA